MSVFDTSWLFQDSEQVGLDTLPRLEGASLRRARTGWVILAAAALALLISSLPGYLGRFQGQLAHGNPAQMTGSVRFFAAASGVASLFSATLSLALAWMFFRHRFEQPIAAVLSVYLLLYGVLMAGPIEHWASYWTGSLDYVVMLQGALTATPTIALLALFPSGRFVPKWMRSVLLLAIPWGLLFFLLPPFSTAGFSQRPLLWTLVSVSFVPFMVTGLWAQVYRYRHVSSSEERQQTKWVVYGFVLWIIYMVLSSGPYFYLNSLPPQAPLPWWAPASELGWWLSTSIIPLTMTIATTRHRLWNIDWVINRTVVYVGLTASVIGLYRLCRICCVNWWLQ